MRTRRFFSFALSGALALIALAALAGGTLASSVVYDGGVSPDHRKHTPTPTASPTPVQYAKYYVCKYVGTPGVDERLKDGKQPIEVSRSAIKDNFANHVVLIGGTFSDAHGRSYVVGYVGQVPAPTAADCLGYITPDPTPTAPEATPTTPEATPTAPEATPTAPEATPTAPEATPTAPEATPTAPEATPTQTATATETASEEVAGETATASSSDNGFDEVAGATALPKLTTTPAPTSTEGAPAGNGTPLFALLICLAFSSLGLAAALGQRRSIRN